MVVTETYLSKPIINKSKLLVEIAHVLYFFIHMYMFPFCLSLCYTSYLAGIKYVVVRLLKEVP